MLEPAPLAGAMLIRTDETDLIIYDQAADADQQLRLIGHEVAHLLLGHHARERPSPFTHLDPAAVAETVTFHGYSQADEREADDFARLLLSAASRWNRRARTPTVRPVGPRLTCPELRGSGGARPLTVPAHCRSIPRRNTPPS